MNPFITLNTGSGLVDILGDYASWFVGTLYPVGGTYQSLNTLVFDATLNAWIRFGMEGGGGPASIGISGCVPPEADMRPTVRRGWCASLFRNAAHDLRSDDGLHAVFDAIL